MFKYNEKSLVNIEMNKKELFSTINADKPVKNDAENVDKVVLSYILSPNTSNYEASELVKEIYIVDIMLSTNRVPDLFIDCFNKSIMFQTLFRVWYKDEVKYIISLKSFDEEKLKILKTYKTSWNVVQKKDLPDTSKLEKIFKSMIEYVSGYKFRVDETFKQYVARTNSIKKLQLEIEKQTKTMLAERQPNIKMEMNDRIKLLKKELKDLEE